MNKSKDGYGYLVYVLVVVVAWAVVPAFAKLGALPGGLTTAYVNWFAVFGLVVIMHANGSWLKLKEPQPYAKMVVWGLVWPLVYSIAYFTTVDQGGASLATITNYTWPVFYLGLATMIFGRRFSRRSWMFTLLAVIAVAVAMMGEASLTSVVFIGLVAAASQALYSVLTEGSKENAWVVTFVVSVVTAIGATIYTVVMENWVWLSDPSTLFYLGFIGVLSNGVGFWAFLKANQTSSESEGSKTVFLVLMCTIPLVQVVILPLFKVETVTPERWLAVLLITGALFGYRVTAKGSHD